MAFASLPCVLATSTGVWLPKTELLGSLAVARRADGHDLLGEMR